MPKTSELNLTVKGGSLVSHERRPEHLCDHGREKKRIQEYLDYICAELVYRSLGKKALQ